MDFVRLLDAQLGSFFRGFYIPLGNLADVYKRQALCLAQGILAIALRTPTPGFYAGALFLCQVTVYPIISYMLRHRDYSLLAGYDAAAAYDFSALRHMVALLHAFFSANGLLAVILGLILFFAPPCFPWLIPVSDTHLDVYKRQTFSSAVQRDENAPLVALLTCTSSNNQNRYVLICQMTDSI